MKVVSRKSVKVRLETVGWMDGWMEGVYKGEKPSESTDLHLAAFFRTYSDYTTSIVCIQAVVSSFTINMSLKLIHNSLSYIANK